MLALARYSGLLCQLGSVRLSLRGMKRKKNRDVISFFQQLGGSIEDTWRRVNYDADVFPEIALAALDKYSPARHITPAEIIDHVARTKALPYQWDVQAEFSNLPITLFNGPRFYIDIYYWLDGTTTIHQHSFAGAFQVLAGSSLHSHYEFTPTKVANPHFSIGRLRLLRAEVLSKGSIKRIIPGAGYIHSLFHLTVRTPGLPHAQPQFLYLKPGIAIDPFFKEATLYKKAQVADLLIRMNHANADPLLKQMLKQSDLQTAFMLLGIAFRHFRTDRIEQQFGVQNRANRFDKLETVARERHRDSLDVIYDTFLEDERQRNVVERRGYVTDEELRFFLALLLNVSGRKPILDLILQRFPDETPIDKVLDWIEELSRIRLVGANSGNALGFDNFDDLHLVVTECLVREKSLAQTQHDVKRVLRHTDLEDRVKEVYNRLKNDSILAPLFVT
jgi:hypothetical protein